MLKIIINEQELYDDKEETFYRLDETILELEHSLASVSKWESKYQKPFLGRGVKTIDEILGYIEMMIITQNIDPMVVRFMTEENLKDINAYIESSQSATTFGKLPPQRGPSETITSELIYYWLVAFNIPFETENWHLNRLFALIRICNIKNSKPVKKSKGEMARERDALNKERRARLGSSG